MLIYKHKFPIYKVVLGLSSVHYQTVSCMTWSCAVPWTGEDYFFLLPWS